MPTRLGAKHERVDPRISALGLCGRLDPRSDAPCLLPHAHPGRCAPGDVASPPRAELEQHLVAQLLVVTLGAGRDAQTCPRLQHRLHRSGEGLAGVVLDLTHVDRLDSHDLDALARIHLDVTRRGARLALVGDRSGGAVAALHERLTGATVHSTVADALVGVGTERSPVLSRSVDLPHNMTAARDSRAFVRAAAAEWQLESEVTEKVVDIASELTANAVKHGAGTITQTLETDAERVTAAVWDGSPQPPRLLPYRPGVSQTGLGLRIVQQLAWCWGFRTTPDGKFVWAAIPRSRPQG